MKDYYSPKEILILESVIDMFLAGASFYNMKVADIAVKAGIGKGTVYEYFSSKEEIISKAVAYRIWQELGNISREIAAAENFYQCSHTIFSKILSCGKSFSPYLLLRLEVGDLVEIFKAMDSMRHLLVAKEEEVIAAYLDLGVKEGCLDKAKAEKMGFQTVISAFMGFNAMGKQDGSISGQDLIETAYSIIIGTLSK